MGTLRAYEVPAGRHGEHTGVVQLDDEAVKRLEAAGVKPKLVEQKAAKPANKSRTAANKK